MRLGIIVDGQAERYALPGLLGRLRCPHAIVGPLYTDIQPMAPVGRIVASVGTRIAILEHKGVERCVVLLDREERNECVPEWVGALEAELRRRFGGSRVQGFDVVAKDRKFENWLISDLDALIAMRRRFRVSEAQRRAVEPNKAGSVNGEAFMRAAVVRGDYAKVADSKRILDSADPMKIARNSRSFRRLLRVLDHGAYASQSRRPQ